MNRPGTQPTTNAAAGVLRRRFRVAQVEQVTAAGIFLEGERFELIGGEIVPTHAKGDRHEILKSAMNSYWARNLPRELPFTTDTTFRLSSDSFLEPDFVFYPKAEGREGLTAKTALLVAEIVDTSLGYDLGRKAGLYAASGIAACPRWRFLRSPSLSCPERRSDDVDPTSTAKLAKRWRRRLSLSELIAQKVANKSESGLLARDAASEPDRRWAAMDDGEAAVPHDSVPIWMCQLDQA